MGKALNILVILAFGMNVWANEGAEHKEHGADHNAEKKSGANMNLFPPPQADTSKVLKPGKPELLEPTYRAQITGETVTLKWTKVATADAYHLQVATDPNFKWLVVNQSVDTTTFDVKKLEKSAHYFWRVAAMKTDNDPSYMKGWFSLSTFETP